MTEPPLIKAVVFDLDGLMINTEEIYCLTGTEQLRRRGKTATRELFDRMMGRRPPEAFQIMIEMMDLSESYEVLLEESVVIFEELLDEHLRPMPGLFQLLARIEMLNLPKGVATSSRRNYLEQMLSRFELLDRFHTTLTAEDVTHGKPHPEIYLKAAERLEIEAAEMLVLEDSQAGTESAAAAGAYVISVPHEHSRAHDFSQASAIAERLNDPVVLDLLG